MTEAKREDSFNRFLEIVFVACIALGGLGESKVFSFLPDGISKVFTLAVIALAVLAVFVRHDFDNFRKCSRYIVVQMLPVIVVFMFTLIVFCMDFANTSTITRSLTKLVFQVMTCFVAISAAYLFGLRCVDLFFWGLVIANAGIMLLSVPRYGVGPSIKSVITCIVTFGDAEGYVRELEIHDVTFVFGQLVLYYLLLEEKKSKGHKLITAVKIALCMFFFLVGLKRVAILAVGVVYVAGIMVRRSKASDKIAVGICFAFSAIAWAYVYVVNSGLFTRFLESFGINMMGRNNIWAWAGDYYEFSLTFFGNGFESVRVIMADLVERGLMTRINLFHNDFLRVFIEIGFWGFAAWIGVLYIFYPCYWYYRNPKSAGFSYFVLIMYMSATYLTDNTAFYFWVSIGLRMIPVAIAVDAQKQEETGVWKAPAKALVRDQVDYLMSCDRAVGRSVR